MYNENKEGAKMEPWGTPQVRGATNETEPPMTTEKVLFVRKDLNQIRALPWMPTYCSRRDSKIPWSTVSNAAARSKSIKMPESPESTDNKMSFITLSKADSVLWLVLKLD